MSSTKDHVRVGLETPLPSSATATLSTPAQSSTTDDIVTWRTSDSESQPSLITENRRLSGALQQAEVQLTTKQRIIDDVLQSLQKCLKESSDLQIQNEILKSRLHTDGIEQERLKKSCDWYRAQLHNVQKELRVAQRTAGGSGEEEKALQRENQRLKVELQRALSQCANANQRLELEKERWMRELIPDHPVRPTESKDSGIFSESTDSSSEIEIVADPHHKSTEENDKELQLRLDDQSSRCQQLSGENRRLAAECEMLHQQMRVKANLMEVQEKSLDQLREELKRTNETMEGRREEHDRVVSYLSACRQRVAELMQENSDVHRESLKMILRFEKISSIIVEYRQAICTKDNQLRELMAHTQRETVDNCSQTRRREKEICEKAVQINAPPLATQEGSYYRNLIKVIEREHRQKLQQRDVNMRTLMRKVREQMRLAKENANRREELEAEVRLFLQRVLPADRAHDVLNDNPDELAVVVQELRRLTNIVIPEKSSLLVTSTTEDACKSCDSANMSLKEATTQMAELKEALVKAENQRQMERKCLQAQIATLEGSLIAKTESNESLEQAIRVLEMERRALDCAVEMLKEKLAEKEEQLLTHAKLKDSAESERKRHHQMMLLLIKTRNERDELVCQNEDLNRLLRGFLFVREQSPTITSKANEALKRCAKFNKSSKDCLEPINEGICALRQEIKSLNSAILWRNRGEISLLDELEAIDQRASF